MERAERKSDLVEKLFGYGVIPVVSLSRSEQAVPLAESLVAGGLPCAEITFRTAAAASAIAQIRQRVPEVLLGAGTVLTLEQLDAALDAGADVPYACKGGVCCTCKAKPYFQGWRPCRSQGPRQEP